MSLNEWLYIKDYLLGLTLEQFCTQVTRHHIRFCLLFCFLRKATVFWFMDVHQSAESQIQTQMRLLWPDEILPLSFKIESNWIVWSDLNPTIFQIAESNSLEVFHTIFSLFYSYFNFWPPPPSPLLIIWFSFDRHCY